MSKHLENKRTMYASVLTLLKANAAKYASLPAITEGVAEFEGLVQAVNAKTIETAGATAGKTAAKYDAEDVLVELLVPIASALFAWGRKEKRADVKEKTDVTEYGLRRMRDTDLVNKAREIHALAVEHAAGLAGYTITAEMTSELQNAITGFADSLGERESSVAQRVGLRQTLNDLIRQTDEALIDGLDRTIELLRQSEPEFYNQYFSARSIKNMGAARKATTPEEAPKT